MVIDLREEKNALLSLSIAAPPAEPDQMHNEGDGDGKRSITHTQHDLICKTPM